MSAPNVRADDATLRDLFAGVVAAGLVAHPGFVNSPLDRSEVAQTAYSIAEELLNDRAHCAAVHEAKDSQARVFRRLVEGLASIPYGQPIDTANLTSLIAMAREAIGQESPIVKGVKRETF